MMILIGAQLMGLNRGEVWLANMNSGHKTEPGKTRPVLVIQSQDLLDAQKQSTVVLIMTSQINADANAYRFFVNARDDLRLDSDVLIDQIRTVDNSRFKLGPLTQLTQTELDIVGHKLLKIIS